MFVWFAQLTCLVHMTGLPVCLALSGRRAADAVYPPSAAALQVTLAKRAADEAHRLAEMAFTGAELNHNRTDAAKLRVEELLVQINDFLSGDGASPQAIRDMAQETQDMSISLRPEQITELARQINETMASLTNIQDILDDTAEDLAAAKSLKQRADAAKAEAERILETAQSVLTALERADTAQEAAGAAMGSAETNIEQAEEDLTSVRDGERERERGGGKSVQREPRSSCVVENTGRTLTRPDTAGLIRADETRTGEEATSFDTLSI